MEANINSAIKSGYLQQVRFLLEYGHSVNERDDQLRTPLINCAFIGDEEWAVGLARLFIEKGAAISLRDKSGLNALHYAVVQEKRRLVQLYLSALDFNINASDKYGNTALHYASSVGNVDIIRDLLITYSKYGLNVNKVNRNGETALIQAWKAGNYECGDVLVKYDGVDTSIKDNAKGLTAREWQQISRKRTQNWQAGKEQQYSAMNRPKSALKQIQLNHGSGRESLSKRHAPPSAPVRRRSIGPNFGKENDLENDPLPAGLRKAKTSIYYPPASVTDLRNNPQYIFQVSPVDFFTCPKKQGSFPFAGEKFSLDNSSSRLRITPRVRKTEIAGGSSSWRAALKTYLNQYNFQFAHSYRKTAIPPEPEPEENLEERPESPAVSELTESDLGKKGGKKSSVGSSTESVNAKGPHRRVSRIASTASNDDTPPTRGERLKSAKPGSRDGLQSRTSFIRK